MYLGFLMAAHCALTNQQFDREHAAWQARYRETLAREAAFEAESKRRDEEFERERKARHEWMRRIDELLERSERKKP